MGLLKSDQLRNAAGTGNADLFKQWAAKMWANLNGTGTIALRDSRNVASIVDNGVGSYNFNYTSAFANANYAPVAAGDGTTTHVAFTSQANLTTSMRVVTYTASGTLVAADATTLPLLIAGDIA